MATKAASKPKRLKNPGVNLLPRLDPRYPIRPVIDTATQIRATIVILPLPENEGFVASTLEDNEVLEWAYTRKAAQTAAMNAFIERQQSRGQTKTGGHAVKPGAQGFKQKSVSNPDEDAEDIRDFRARRKEKTYSWESVKRELGL